MFDFPMKNCTSQESSIDPNDLATCEQNYREIVSRACISYLAEQIERCCKSEYPDDPDGDPKKNRKCCNSRCKCFAEGKPCINCLAGEFCENTPEKREQKAEKKRLAEEKKNTSKAQKRWITKKRRKTAAMEG